MNRRRALLLVIALVVGACNVNIAGKQLAGMPASYTVQAQMPTTIGLYPGSFVRQLGIDVGSVSKVENQGDHVLVTMKIIDKYHLADGARAILIGDSVLGERYVQFEPAYVSGTPMKPGTVLGPDRVTVPVETDTVLRSLNTVLRGINPTDIKGFTTNLAQVLQGEGAKLNTLIQGAAGTFQVLADKGNELGQLTGTLAKLTGQLDTKDQALANLIRDYDSLSQTIAADKSQLDGTITELSDLTTQGASLLAPNLSALQHDVAIITTVGQTLDRNVPALDVGVQYSKRLFAAAQLAYDPLHNWLPLNPATSPPATSAALGAEIRDALASLCRRLGTKQPALATALSACGDPNSSFFNSIIGLLPTLLDQIPGQTAPTTANAAFDKGVAAIPGLNDEQRNALVAPSALAPPAVATAPGPPGVAAVAALSQVSVFAASPARTHHRGVIGGFVHWLGGLL